MLKVKRLHPDAKLPTVAHPGEDVAYDLYAVEDVILRPFEVTKVRTGVAVAAYSSLAGQPLGLLIRDRSSMAAKGIVVNAGVVDAGYRGEIIVCMTLLKPESFEYSDGLGIFAGKMTKKSWVYEIKAGDKVAQMIPILVLTGGVQETDDLGDTKRGTGGFGSTGA
jgi:dUTP pyrophosphatase